MTSPASNTAGSDAVDSRALAPAQGGNTSITPVAPRGCSKLWTVCIFILVVEMCERLCYYTVAGSMRNFLEDAGPSRVDPETGETERGMSQSGAISISSCFMMLSYLSCILGGYLADNRLGRYRTILYFAVLYVLGDALVAISAIPAVMSTVLCEPMFLFATLVMVALGTGAIKPNVMNFGADQYDASDPIELEQQKSFFSWFYLAINIGGVGAFGFTVNLATAKATKENPGVGYLEAYCIAAGAMTLALLIFVSGTPRYNSTGSVTHTPMISVIRKYMVAAAKITRGGKAAAIGWILMPIYMGVVLAGSLMNGWPTVSANINWCAMVLCLISCALLIVVHVHNSFIDGDAATDSLTTGISLGEVKGALACVPTILCISTGFAIPYNAMNNAYPAQACQMDTRLFGDSQLNGAFFSLGDAFAIIILVPVFESVIFPLVARCQGGRPMSRWAKYTMGFGLVIVANVVAALIEYKRRGMSEGDNPNFVLCPEGTPASQCTNTTPSYLLSKCSPKASIPMTNMTAFWTVVPMFLTGAGEILVNPVIYQYVFENAPPRLRSIVQALNLVAAGSISNAIAASLAPLIPENFNEGHLVYYFYVNIAFAIVFLASYYIVDAVGPPPVLVDPTGSRSGSRLLASGGEGGPNSIQSGSVIGRNKTSSSFTASMLAAADRGGNVVGASDATAALLHDPDTQRPAGASSLRASHGTASNQAGQAA